MSEKSSSVKEGVLKDRLGVERELLVKDLISWLHRSTEGVNDYFIETCCFIINKIVTASTSSSCLSDKRSRYPWTNTNSMNGMRCIMNWDQGSNLSLIRDTSICDQVNVFLEVRDRLWKSREERLIDLSASKICIHISQLLKNIFNVWIRILNWSLEYWLESWSKRDYVKVRPFRKWLDKELESLFSHIYRGTPHRTWSIKYEDKLFWFQLFNLNRLVVFFIIICVKHIRFCRIEITNKTKN